VFAKTPVGHSTHPLLNQQLPQDVEIKKSHVFKTTLNNSSSNSTIQISYDLLLKFQNKTELTWNFTQHNKQYIQLAIQYQLITIQYSPIIQQLDTENKVIANFDEYVIPPTTSYRSGDKLYVYQGHQTLTINWTDVQDQPAFKFQMYWQINLQFDSRTTVNHDLYNVYSVLQEMALKQLMVVQQTFEIFDKVFLEIKNIEITHLASQIAEIRKYVDKRFKEQEFASSPLGDFFESIGEGLSSVGRVVEKILDKEII